MKQSTLGSYIRSLRTQNNMTQAQLAQKLNVTDKAVSKWERDISCPDISLIPKLANVLGVQISDLLSDNSGEGHPSRLTQIFDMSHDVRTPLHMISHNADEELSEEFDFTGKRILIAEDMEINREIVQELLKQTGAFCEFAKDGMNCLDMVENAPGGYYDLILMDVLMPRMDGIEATKRIRSLHDSQKAQIPIIAVTANVCEKDWHLAMKAGMDAFIEKPIIKDKLFGTMKRYL